MRKNLNTIHSQIIINQLINNDIVDFCIAPGLRNTPLIYALKKNPRAKIHTGMDERSLAFKALGISKYSCSPTVLICTSGSAMANFFPAIIEAYKSKVPFIIITADRPIELTHSDANQCIYQMGMYKNFVHKELNLEAPSEHTPPTFINRQIYEIVQRSKDGPVHINIPFREPLLEEVNISQKYQDKAFKIVSNANMQNNVKTFKTNSIKTEILGVVKDKIKSAVNPLIVVGPVNPKSINHRKEFISFLKKQKIFKFIDVTSSIKYEFSINESTPTFDHQEVYKYFNENSPDLIIHFGGRLVSKFFYRFLEDNDDIFYTHINESFYIEDPASRVNMHINMHPIDFINENKSLFEFKDNSNLLDIWQNSYEKKSNIIELSELSFPVISKTIINGISKNSHIFIGNSTAIRSFDSFMSKQQKKDLFIYTNRGASGIEGNISTSLGLSSKAKIPVTCILGDISAIHDLNALAMLNQGKEKIRVIIVNNKCGGIFSLLPVKKEEEVLQIISTEHNFNFSHLAEFYNMAYHKIQTKNELSSIIKKEITKSEIIEIFVDNQKNIDIYNQLKTVEL